MKTTKKNSLQNLFASLRDVHITRTEEKALRKYQSVVNRIFHHQNFTLRKLLNYLKQEDGEGFFSFNDPPISIFLDKLEKHPDLTCRQALAINRMLHDGNSTEWCDEIVPKKFKKLSLDDQLKIIAREIKIFKEQDHWWVVRRLLPALNIENHPAVKELIDNYIETLHGHLSVDSEIYGWKIIYAAVVEITNTHPKG